MLYTVRHECSHACEGTCVHAFSQSNDVVVVVALHLKFFVVVGDGNFFHCHVRNKESGTEILALKNCIVSFESKNFA